jgi:hypothetical protein
MAVGGEDVGELPGDPEPMPAVKPGGRPVVAGGGRDRAQATVVHLHPGQPDGRPGPHPHRWGAVLDGVGDRFPDRGHDIVGVMVAQCMAFGPPVEQAPNHHKLTRTGHRQVELHRSGGGGSDRAG